MRYVFRFYEHVDYVSKYNERYIAIFFKQIRDRIFERYIDLFQNNEKYFEYIKIVIEIFYKNDYYTKSLKYFFFQKYIKFCEHVIENDKIQTNEKKLKIIRN